MTATFTEDVPLSVLDGSDGMMRVTFTYSPGMDACGPAYDHGGLPAEPPEIELREVWYVHSGGSLAAKLADDGPDKIVEWLMENWEPPTGPEPDDERDRRGDEELESRS